MPALLIAFIIFDCMLSGMLLGSYLRLVLSDHHTQASPKDILMTSAGTMATLVALIIGLLVTSAKDTYDVTNASITQAGANIITLDYYLSRYGPEAKGDRVLLGQALVLGIERIWPGESKQGRIWRRWKRPPRWPMFTTSFVSSHRRMNSKNIFSLRLRNLVPR